MSSSNYIDDADYFHVVGEVENGSPSVIGYVEVVCTFYDADKRVVETSSSYINPSYLNPGIKAPFEIILLPASVPVKQIALPKREMKMRQISKKKNDDEMKL